MTDEELARRLGATALPVGGALREVVAQYCFEWGCDGREDDMLLAIARAARSLLVPGASVNRD